MPSSPPLESSLAAAWPVAKWQDETVLLAVSGGADSVALLRAMTQCSAKADGGRIHVAHFNHGLRGGESDADLAFVADLCERLGVDCELGATDVAALAAEQGDGVEAAARHARYEFLKQTAQRIGARYVATAHTADDQAETILHRIVRGTGLAGLAGMPTVRELCHGIALVRPMLRVGRVEVIDYLESLDQPYREDTSNRDLRYTRNRIRQQLLPLLEADYNPAAAEAILRLGQLAGEAQQILDRRVEAMWDSAIVQIASGTARVNCPALRQEDDYLVRELLVKLWRHQDWPQQQMGLAQWEQLAALVRSEAVTSPAISLPGNIRAKKEGEQLLLTRPR